MSVFPSKSVLKSISYNLLFITQFICCGGYITEAPEKTDEDFTKREYEYFIPSTNSQNNPSPVIFVFHGFQSSAWSMRYATQFDEYAEENNLIIIYPIGVSGYWNCYDPCSTLDDENYDDRGYFDFPNYDDIGFVEYLLEKFNSEYFIDNSKIYATGFSLGARFLMTLALERSNIFAAIAPVGGSMTVPAVSKFNGAERIPIMILFGTLDEWEGFGSGDCERLAIPDLVSYWISHNGCEQTPLVEHLPDTGEDYIHVIRETYIGSTGYAETIFIKVEGGIHEWFMFDEFNATETIIEFFLRHSL
ncbi:MAG: hypothetical protein A2V66_16110 [Ignavibacteria bacterium RBG_13_36_8]|nr:MAG: hypothetical protein A2V66_16110 [Ignavibacteria bacterium RBG_13_36_8]